MAGEAAAEGVAAPLSSGLLLVRDGQIRRAPRGAFHSDKASIFRSTQVSTDFGRGTTQYGRALFELNIDIWCANSSQAKGRAERTNLTLQDRLVKELRLREFNTREAANAFAPHFIADFNTFAKPLKRDFDAHRAVRADENLDLIFTWRLQRKVSLSLTLQHERAIRSRIPLVPSRLEFASRSPLDLGRSFVLDRLENGRRIVPFLDCVDWG